MRTYFVYILASHSRTLYIGVTSDLERRVYQHKQKLVSGFTDRYNVNQLVHIEDYFDINEAIAWSRGKKVELIERDNPGWHDLSAGWYPEEQSVRSP
jgi:putative endonuclease